MATPLVALRMRNSLLGWSIEICIVHAFSTFFSFNNYFVGPVYTWLGLITSKSVVAKLKAEGAKENPVVTIVTTIE